MKKVKITRCNDCPHFDNQYYDYRRECDLLNDLEITTEMCDVYTEVYKECPLMDWEE